MPVYNTALYLAEAIESILNQSFTDFEFIISDDGSTDGSKELIQKYAQLDKRIIFLNNEKNRGICPNLNDMLSIAQGKYIAIMESDDISMVDRFQLEVNEFISHPNLSLLGSKGYFIDANGIILSAYKYNITDINITNLTFFTPGVMFLKKIISEIHGFKNGYVWDMDFYYNIYFGGYETKVIDNNLVKKRIFPESTLSTNFLVIHKELFYLRCFIIKKFALNRKYYLGSFIDLIISRITYASKKLGIYNYISPIWIKYILRR